MRSSFLLPSLFMALSLGSACQPPAQQGRVPERNAHVAIDDPADTTVVLRFMPPPGYSRPACVAGSFASFLRDLPLKKPGLPVLKYDGRMKNRQDVHAAVLNVSVGTKDLQQCADAVMRLRAEFLYANGRQDEIAFEFTSGFKAEWKHWRMGERIKVDGSACRWVPGHAPDASREQLLHYLEMVFTYAGTLSLQRELARGPGSRDLDIGDVFIQGGSPGHAVIVVDKALDAKGRTVFLLAQSYMPAQDVHVLKNLRHPEMGAWFILDGDDSLCTPEWTFAWSGRRHWPK